MKKLYLLLSVGIIFLATSCLKMEEHYSGTSALSYITEDDMGVVYARVMAARGFLLPIVSPEVQDEAPGTFVAISYSWDEKNNSFSNGLYHATVTNISDPIETSIVMHGDAPDREEEIPMVLFNPETYLSEYFDYHLIGSYAYNMGDSDKKKVPYFYHSFQENNNASEVIIDIRLEETDETIDKDQRELTIAIDLEEINDYYSENIPSYTETNIQVRFRYYRVITGTTTPVLYTTDPFNITLYKDN